MRHSPLEGWLVKQGSTKFSAERRRWFELDRRRKVLYYFKKPNLPCTSCLGVIDIMLASSIVPANEKLFQFQINTPGRSYTLTAPSESEFTKWFNGLCHFLMAETRLRPPEADQLSASMEHLRLLPPPQRPQSPAQKRFGPRPMSERSGNQRERSARAPTQSPNWYLDEASKPEIMKEYADLLATHESMVKELEETQEQLTKLQVRLNLNNRWFITPATDHELGAVTGTQRSLEDLARKHEETVGELEQAKHELELAKTQLAETKENLRAEKEKYTKKLVAEKELGQDARQAAELEFVEDLVKLRRESMREMERMAWVWAKEKERWARERAHLQQAIALARDEWELEKRQERKEWGRERREWLDRVALLSGSRGDDEDEDDEDEDGDDADEDDGDGDDSVDAGVAEILFRSFSSLSS